MGGTRKQAGGYPPGMVHTLLALRESPEGDREEAVREIDDALQRLAYDDSSSAVRQAARQALDSIVRATEPTESPRPVATGPRISEKELPGSSPPSSRVRWPGYAWVR
jgi:Arc/MetJ-type ribon-helix-helix transcriptional regulator